MDISNQFYSSSNMIGCIDQNPHSKSNQEATKKEDKKRIGEMVSTPYLGMRRRCLVFEMVGSQRKHIDEDSGSSVVQNTAGNLACNEKQLVAYKMVLVVQEKDSVPALSGLWKILTGFIFECQNQSEEIFT